MDETAFIEVLVIPCLDFTDQFFETPDTSVQTFPAQDTQFDLSHVMPASRTWGVVVTFPLPIPAISIDPEFQTRI